MRTCLAKAFCRLNIRNGSVDGFEDENHDLEMEDICKPKKKSTSTIKNAHSALHSVMYRNRFSPFKPVLGLSLAPIETNR